MLRRSCYCVEGVQGRGCGGSRSAARGLTIVFLFLEHLGARNLDLLIEIALASRKKSAYFNGCVCCFALRRVGDERSRLGRCTCLAAVASNRSQSWRRGQIFGFLVCSGRRHFIPLVCKHCDDQARPWTSSTRMAVCPALGQGERWFCRRTGTRASIPRCR